jgi:3-oxoacyl-[acyl-carrier-protein] synthase II
MFRHRIAITGVGIVNAATVGGFPALGAFLAAPCSAVRRVRSADGSDRLVAPIATDPTVGALDPADSRRLSRASRLTVAAARLALADAGAALPELAVIVGTEFGDFRSTMEFADGYLHRGPVGLSPLLFPNTVMNAMAAATAIAVQARECSLTLNATTVAGELAVARAAAAVGAGRLEAVLTGGVDQLDGLVHELVLALGAAADPRGEGAAFVVLERLDAAQRRGADIRGEILSCAWRALSAPPCGVGRRVEGRAIPSAITEAGLDPSAIGWLYGSASGDPARDGWEKALVDAALPHRPPSAALAVLVGRHSAVGPMQVAAAAWTARSGLLPRSQPADGLAAANLSTLPVAPGPGLVYGVARGGIEVALVVAPAEARQ